jgi:hypothetical protein
MTDPAQVRIDHERAERAARIAALQAELAACRAAGRVARATDQHRRDTAPKEEL